VAEQLGLTQSRQNRIDSYARNNEREGRKSPKSSLRVMNAFKCQLFSPGFCIISLESPQNAKEC